jgi:hypothetical protein
VRSGVSQLPCFRPGLGPAAALASAPSARQPCANGCCRMDLGLLLGVVFERCGAARTARIQPTASFRPGLGSVAGSGAGSGPVRLEFSRPARWRAPFQLSAQASGILGPRVS